MKKKKKPIRKCIACNEHYLKSEMIRIVRDKEKGIAFVDRSQKSNGRGAYCCKNKNCLAKVIEHNFIPRHLKVKLSNEEKEKLIKMIDG